MLSLQNVIFPFVCQIQMIFIQIAFVLFQLVLAQKNFAQLHFRHFCVPGPLVVRETEKAFLFNKVIKVQPFFICCSNAKYAIMSSLPD